VKREKPYELYRAFSRLERLCWMNRTAI